MKSLTSATRRGGLAAVAALSALALSACSAGQITQTADKPVAVDGANTKAEEWDASVLDVLVQVNDITGDASLKFTATNQDVRNEPITLQSVSVDGQEVEMGPTLPIEHNCMLVGHSAEDLDVMPDTERTASCTQTVVTSLENDNFAYGGTVPVAFEFDFGTITVDAAVSAPNLPSGQAPRDVSADQF